jgi:hypothetical protein
MAHALSLSLSLDFIKEYCSVLITWRVIWKCLLVGPSRFHLNLRFPAQLERATYYVQRNITYIDCHLQTWFSDSAAEVHYQGHIHFSSECSWIVYEDLTPGTFNPLLSSIYHQEYHYLLLTVWRVENSILHHVWASSFSISSLDYVLRGNLNTFIPLLIGSFFWSTLLALLWA